MYSPYPPYGYMPGPYDTSQYASAPYESYYAEQPQQMPLTSVPPPRPPPPAPLQQRLSIRDPTTGSVVPVVTPEQIEQAVSSHHKKRPKSEDLVSLDLEELAANCQADYSEWSDKELQDPNAFALSALQPAAKQGLPHCQYYLGRCYETDQGGLPGTPDLCQTWFKKASDQGIAEASYKLGQCFEDGWGCAKSLSEAVRLYNIAAHGGVQAAKLRLGFLHELGAGVSQNFEAALKLYQQAADMAEGAFCAARCHENGIGTKVDLEKAKQLYQRAYNKGSWQAADCLFSIWTQLAVSDVQSVSSDQSGKAAGSSLPSRSDTKPKSVLAPAFVPDQGKRKDDSPSSQPDLKAQPFVPTQAAGTALKPQAKEFKPQANGTVPVRKVPKIAPPTGATAKPHLKPQAPVFKPKQAASSGPPVPATKEHNFPTKASSDGKQHEKVQAPAAVTVSSTGSQPRSQLSDTAATAVTASPAKKQPNELPPAGSTKGPDTADMATAVQKSPAKPAMPSTPMEEAPAAPAEDLDALHTEQMSAAWAALDAATGAEQPTADAIQEALRHARPYRELAEHVKAAEGFLQGITSNAHVKSPNKQQTEAPVITAEPPPSSAASDQEGEAHQDDSVPGDAHNPISHDNLQQHGASSIAGSEVLSEGPASSTSAQLYDDAEAAQSAASTHHDVDEQDAHHADVEGLGIPAFTPRPNPAEQQTASVNKFVLSPNTVASAKAAAVLALAQPAVRPKPHTAASTTSGSSRDQPEQHTHTDSSTHVPADRNASTETNEPGLNPQGSMLGLLSFLLPAENPAASASPSREAPPGFTGPNPSQQRPPTARSEALKSSKHSAEDAGSGAQDPLGQSALGTASDNGAQLPMSQPQGPPRRAKPYQSLPTRASAAPYQPPDVSAYNPPKESNSAVHNSLQQEQSLPREPAQQQQTGADNPQRRRAPAYNPRPQQQQPPRYNPVQEQRPAAYDPTQHAGARESAVLGDDASIAGRPTGTCRASAAFTYNPPEAMDSFISSASGQVAAEQSEDDYLAELLGMNSGSPPSPVSEAVAAPSEPELPMDAILEHDQQPDSEHVEDLSAVQHKQAPSTQDAAPKPPSEGPSAPADVAQPPSPPTTAADDKPEAPVIEHTATAEPETAEHYSDPAQASTSGPSTMVHTDSAEHNRVAQSDSAQQSLEADTGMREHDTGVQSSSSKADSLAADNSSASKKRAVDADYSVSGAESKGKKKAGAASAVKMPAGSAVGAVAEPSSQAAAAPAEHNHPSGAEQAAPTATASAAAQPAAVVTAAATDAPSSVADAQEGGMEGSSPARSASSSSLNVPPAFLPPKPKPGGNKVKTVRPSHEASSAVEQPQVLALPPQQPLSAVEQPSAPAPQQPPQQAAPTVQQIKGFRDKAQQAPGKAGQHPRALSDAAVQKEAGPSKRALKREAYQAKLSEKFQAAPSSGSSNRQQAQQGQQAKHQGDDGDWETVGHKAGSKQAAAKKQSLATAVPVQQPQTQAHSAAQEAPLQQPQLEASSVQQPQSVTEQPPAPPWTLAPNCAWAKKLDLQSVGSGNAATGASSLSAAAIKAPEKPPPKGQAGVAPPSASSNAEETPVPASSSSTPAVKPGQNPPPKAQPNMVMEHAAASSSLPSTAGPSKTPQKSPQKAQGGTTAASSSSSATAPFTAPQKSPQEDAAAASTSASAAPPQNPPHQPQQAPPASAAQTGKGKGKKKKGQKQEAQGVHVQQGVNTGAAKQQVKGSPGAAGASTSGQAAPAAQPGTDSNKAASVVQGNAGAIKKRQEDAMLVIVNDHMKVTEANKNAWEGICTCPLSLGIMREPVVACDGITYERIHIAEWMQRKQTSPWTMAPFDNLDLTPNILVSRLIQKFDLVDSEFMQ